MFTDEELRSLIRTRPDAFFPTPPTQGALATRLALPGSVARALRTLNAADLRALETLADLGAELDPVDARELGLDLTRLRQRALIRGPEEAVRIAPGTLTAMPPGWRISDTAPTDTAERIAALAPRERKVMDTMAGTGGVGSSRAEPGSPVANLIEQGLLVRVNETTVRLPRPVRDALSGHTPRVFPTAAPPPRELDQQHVDEAAAAQGLESVRQMRQLITHLLAEPSPLNKDGTVGVRALANLTKALDFDPVLLITIGESGGLIGRGAAEDQDVLAPTRDALTWLDATLSDQWAILITAWAASPWRVDQGHKLLSSEMHAPDLRHARMEVLRAGGDLQRLLFQAPLAAASMRDQLIDTITAEAHTVGVLALGAASTPLKALLSGGDVAAATAPLVPAEVHQLIAQADMTILAPGPLAPEVARTLERFAELESPGLASVWRVGEASISKGLNSGLTSQELHAWLEDHLIGEVPQALSFLLDDVSRNHGSLRTGTALSYVRSDDPALIATAAAQVSELRALAPTVAVSSLTLAELVRRLRSAGLQPTAENADGVELNIAPEPVLVPPTPSTIPRERTVDDDQADRIVAALMTADTGAAEETASGDTLETLRAAARGRRHVRLGYVDKHGRGQTLTVLPLSVTAGQVDALDEVTDRVVRIALPRITRVVLG